jgi:lysyl-tRNA synthetase class 1
MVIKTPPEIEKVIQDFDGRSDAFDRLDVMSALNASRQALGQLSENQHKAAWADILAFALVGCGPAQSPWKTHFGPIASGELADGTSFYSPDVAQADAEILEHWCKRSRETKHPALRARYADLRWDLSKTIAGIKREFEDVQTAIDAYVAATLLPAADLQHGFADGKRALELSLLIGDADRVRAAKGAILHLHARSLVEGEFWWEAYDILVGQKKVELADAERDALVADLETAMARHGDTNDPHTFNPHFVQMIAARLVAHYQRLGLEQEALRCHLAVAQSAEHHASVANALLASAVLQTSMAAYRSAGLPEQAERIRREMAVKNREAQAEMKEVHGEFSVTFDQIEEFLSRVIKPTAEQTFASIGATFLLKRAALEELVAQEKRVAPLSSLVTQSISDGDHVVATVGSVDEDPNGRLLRQALFKISVHTPFLGWAMDRAIETHGLTAVDIVRHVNKVGLFGDGGLVFDGLEAFFAGDFVKASHILIPQIERGFRNVIEAMGGPSTKPHPRFSTAQVVITMGDIMHDRATLDRMGKVGDGISLQIATLYADSRAWNIRNDLAHGILDRQAMTRDLCLWLVHSLLLMGSLFAPAAPPTN